MTSNTRTHWAPTVRLATMLSIVAALVGVVLVRIAEVPETAVVIGVMVVGCAASVVSSGHQRAARPASLRVTSHRHRSAA